MRLAPGCGGPRAAHGRGSGRHGLARRVAGAPARVDRGRARRAPEEDAVWASRDRASGGRPSAGRGDCGRAASRLRRPRLGHARRRVSERNPRAREWSGWQRRQHVASWRQRLLTAAPPAGHRRHRARGAGVAREPVEHVEILPLDDRPAVVGAEIGAAVAAKRRGDRRRRFQHPHRLDELRVVVVVEAGVAPHRLPAQHVALAVGQHRLAERPCFERHHRQALEVGRHDQELGGGQRVVLLLVADEAQVPDARMIGHGQHGRADEHQREPARRDLAVALPEIEQLGAALVLVDPADVDGRAVLQAGALAEARRM